jgi:3-oxoadipate enol-lactonase
VKVRCQDIGIEVSEWGQGEPLVLVHGLGEDHRAWNGLVPLLAGHRRLIACDVRGHGGTPLGEADGTLGQLGADLLALLQALGLGWADLCGFSLGGTIVLRAAIDAPDRVRRLVAVATSSRVGRTARQWYEDRAEQADRGAAALHPYLEEDTRLQFAGAPGAAADQWLLRRQATADPRGFANACRAMGRLHDEPLDAELHRITAPALVVAAERDQLCPPHAGRAVAAAIPGAELAVVPGCGHPVAVERPEELSRILLDFLARAAQER